MKNQLVIVILGLILLSCQNKTINLQGKWKCTYVNVETLDKTNIIFTDLELFEKNSFEPIFEFTEKELKYHLGFGEIVNSFNDNYCTYRINKETLNLKKNAIIDNFEIKDLKDNNFCLTYNQVKMACFQKIPEKPFQNLSNSTLNFRTINEFYTIDLSLYEDGRGTIFREGTNIKDTINISLDHTESQYINSLIESINHSNFRMQNQISGGDQPKYSLKIKSNEIEYSGQSEGLSHLSFESKSLIVNLENLIMMKYSGAKNN